MVIVHVGSLSLQVGRERLGRTYKEKLVSELRRCVRSVVARCLEEALEAEVTELLDRLRAYKVRPAPDDPPGKYETGTQNHSDVVCPRGSRGRWPR